MSTTLAPPLLSDFFPPERRNRVLTIFYVAIPVGAAAGFKYGMHISIDMFVSMLPAPLRALLQWAMDALVLAFLAYVFWLAILFNQESWDSPTSVLQVSRATVYSSVLVGVAFMAVRYVQTMVQRMRGGRLPLFSMPGSDGTLPDAGAQR